MKQTTKNQMFWMLQDVISYFGKNPKQNRCIDNIKGKCLYNPPIDSKSIGCAIGMYLDNKTASYFDNLLDTSIIDIFSNFELKAKLPKWMQIMPIEFLDDLQTLHDINTFWNKKKGVSDSGKKEILRICMKYGLPFEELTFKY